MLTQPQRRGVEQLKMKKMEKCWGEVPDLKWRCSAPSFCLLSLFPFKHNLYLGLVCLRSGVILELTTVQSIWTNNIWHQEDTITPSIRILDTFLWRSLSLNFWCWFPVENNFPATLFFWEVLWLIDQIRQARAGEGAKVCKQPPTFTNTTFYISYFQIFILLCKTIF